MAKNIFYHCELYVMIFTGFQTLEDRNNPEYFESNGPHKCVSIKAWLGYGYYFWCSDIKWAHKWGADNYGKYMVFKGGIIYDEKIFDIYGNPLHKKQMTEWMNEILYKNPKLNEDDITIQQIIDYAKKHAKFESDYSAIRAADYPSVQHGIKFVSNRKEYTYIGEERVQYCLLSKTNLALRTFMVIFPDKYKN